MSKSNAFETDMLGLIFLGTPIPNLADNAAVAPLTSFAIAAHTADPGEAGTQATNEASYTGYARATVARTSDGWTVTAGQVVPTAIILWPACTGGASPQTLTHFSIGPTGGGATKIFYSGPITPNILVSPGVMPELSTATTVTED